ncbi:MAG: nucleotide exchange factor GrpE [Bacteroidota bacterium]
MNDNPTDNKQTQPENTDNMSQNEALEEALANELNTDDSANKGNFLDESEQEKVDKLEAALDEQKDKYLRLIADFENYKRRTSKETLELRQTAGKEVIQSLLVVLDDMDRAEKQLGASTDVNVIKEGISLVFNKLRNVTQQRGLKAMEAVNLEFNPDIHEAITEIPAPNAKMVGKIIDVVEPGYYLNDKLIRHAKVVVGK